MSLSQELNVANHAGVKNKSLHLLSSCMEDMAEGGGDRIAMSCLAIMTVGNVKN